MQKAIEVINNKIQELLNKCPNYNDDSGGYTLIQDKIDVYYEVIKLLKQAENNKS